MDTFSNGQDDENSNAGDAPAELQFSFARLDQSSNEPAPSNDEVASEIRAWRFKRGQ
jgi:hypothetical protein